MGNNIDIEKYFKPNLKDAKKRKGDADYIAFELENEFQEIGHGKTYRIQTYGCQGNEADSEIMAAYLKIWVITLASEKKTVIVFY